MQGNIGHVGSGPFAGITALHLHPLQRPVFQIRWYLLFPCPHLNQKYTCFLRFGNLVVPPITAIRITPIPIFKSCNNLIIKRLILKIFIFLIRISKNKIRNTIDMNQRLPVCTIRSTIIDIGKRAISRIVFGQSRFYRRIMDKIHPYFVHKYFKFIDFRRSCHSGHKRHHQQHNQPHAMKYGSHTVRFLRVIITASKVGDFS